jgi:DNA-binding MarR family transcriptional regulator
MTRPPVTRRDLAGALDVPAAWAELLPGVDGPTVLSVMWLSRLGRLWETELERRLRAHGLISTEFRVLSSLLLLGPPNQLSLTRLNHGVIVSAGGVTKAVDRLTKAKLVTKRVDPTDRRSVQVRLTAAGRRTTTAVLREVMAAFAEQTDHLGHGRREEVAVALRTLIGTFPGQPELGLGPDRSA